MTHSVDTSQLLFPAIPVIAQWAMKQSAPSGRDGGYAWVLQYGLWTFTHQSQPG